MKNSLKRSPPGLRATSSHRSSLLKKGSRFTTHTLLIGDSFTDDDGKTYLCARDSNRSPESNHACENLIYVDDEGKLIYNEWGELGGASIAHNDSGDALVQREALYEDCAKNKGCPALNQ